MVHCEIKFENNPHGVFYSGQTMAGSVELRLDKPKKVQAFTMKISGNAEVQWTVYHNKNSPDYYSGKEALLHSRIALIQNTVEIPAGTHVYNFSLILPPNLPTSYEGDHGFIRYTAAAVLERPWKFNQSCNVAFTVLTNLDLSSEVLGLARAAKLELDKTFGCWPCTTNPMYIGVEIPMTGYVSGQTIPLIVRLNNTSSVGVQGIKAYFDRTVTYTSQTPKASKKVTKTMAKSKIAVTNDHLAEYKLELKIPSVVPTGSCSILDICYNLIIVADVDFCRKPPTLRFPITIGTVPVILASRVPMNQLLNGASFVPALMQIEELPPPTYEEATNAIFIKVNDEPNDIGNHMYSPRYPVYNYGLVQ